MSALVTPILHPNGDRPEVLLASLECAYRTVRAAIEAVRQCAPNAKQGAEHVRLDCLAEPYPPVGRGPL